MKKLFLSMLCVSAFLFSCASASDENISETAKTSQTRTSSIIKTTEMINFESALKNYMQNKSYFADNNLKEETEKDIRLNATKLLASIGTSESEIDKNASNTGALLSFTLKQYTAFLTATKN